MTALFKQAPDTFALLTRVASRRDLITYGDFASHLGLGAPMGAGRVLNPLLAWCRNRGLPWLPIIVVRKRDGLPSGGYDPAVIEPETVRVFDHDWSAVSAPVAGDLLPFVAKGPTKTSASEVLPC